MVDLVKMKRAIEVVETNGSFNNYPRFEKAYAPASQSFTIQGHTIVGTGAAWNAIVAVRWKQWGMASACSYGAAQLLYHSAADMGMIGHPAALWTDKTTHDIFVNKRLDHLTSHGASTIEEYARGWNGGNPHALSVPQKYIDDVTAAYNAI